MVDVTRLLPFIAQIIDILLNVDILPDFLAQATELCNPSFGSRDVTSQILSDARDQLQAVGCRERADLLLVEIFH